MSGRVDISVIISSSVNKGTTYFYIGAVSVIDRNTNKPIILPSSFNKENNEYFQFNLLSDNETVLLNFILKFPPTSSRSLIEQFSVIIPAELTVLIKNEQSNNVNIILQWLNLLQQNAMICGFSLNVFPFVMEISNPLLMTGEEDEFSKPVTNKQTDTCGNNIKNMTADNSVYVTKFELLE